MKILNKKFSYSAFLNRLQYAQEKVLMLDYDGTLAPFTTKRETAFPYPGIKNTLEKISRTKKTKIIIISGRKANEIVNLLDMEQQPEIWGSHGLENLTHDGVYQAVPMDKTIEKLLEVTYLELKKCTPEEQLEKKYGSIAIHWRGMQEFEANQFHTCIQEKLYQALLSNQFHIYNFDGGMELRYKEANKGNVVKKILSEASTETMFSYLGDDYTDEDAFKLLGARGLSVLVREKLRSTYAHVWIKPPEELLNFLELWV
jgi:trehalose-phosphatase